MIEQVKLSFECCENQKSYRKPATSICEKSKLVELSKTDVAAAAGVGVLVFIFNGEEGGCLMARTLQFMKLFAILLLWAIANLYIHIHIHQMNKNTALSYFHFLFLVKVTKFTMIYAYIKWVTAVRLT